MRMLQGLYFFYQKLLILSAVLSMALSYLILEHSNFYKGVGISLIFLMPAFHYFTYEVRNPNEYYFYYNLGLSKLLLWIHTILMSLFIAFILFLL